MVLVANISRGYRFPILSHWWCTHKIWTATGPICGSSFSKGKFVRFSILYGIRQKVCYHMCIVKGDCWGNILIPFEIRLYYDDNAIFIFPCKEPSSNVSFVQDNQEEGEQIRLLSIYVLKHYRVNQKLNLFHTVSSM